LPMDSLDLATLIVILEINTGLDPFREGFKTFHNVGQLIELYESASA
jgi:acyl carrier protein